jgi:hypothetical protein
VCGLVWSCSLDLDPSLIPASGDAAKSDSQSFGGTDGGSWVDVTGPDGPGQDAGDGANEANVEDDASDAAEGGTVASIDCETVSCTGSEYCCFSNQNGGVCQTEPNGCASITIHCDSTSDCPAPEICCVVDINQVACQPSCPDLLQGPIQLCKTDSECTSGSCGQLPAFVVGLAPSGYQGCQ